jgi:hypothetical protein
MQLKQAKCLHYRWNGLHGAGRLAGVAPVSVVPESWPDFNVCRARVPTEPDAATEYAAILNNTAKL